MMDNNQYYQMCTYLEQMAGMYKDIQKSQTYRDGQRIEAYLHLLKNFDFRGLMERIFKRNNSYDSFISSSSWEMDYSADDYDSQKRIAVYTALFGNYDQLPEPIMKPANIDYYIYTDNELPADTKWNRIDPCRFLDDSNSFSNTDKNRYFKMLPHILFPEYDYSIYVDSNVLIVSDLTPMLKSLDCFPIAMFLHKNRDCVYEEARACINKNKDTKERLEKHIDLLKKNGVPPHSGLLEATIIIRKHSDPLCQCVMQDWWEEFRHESKRDQLSLVDTLWKHSIKIEKVGVLGNNLFMCNKFIVLPHK